MLDEENFGDFADDTSTTVTLPSDGSDITGGIQTPNDRDVFRFDVVAGQTYPVNLSSTGNLPDLFLLNASGNVIDVVLGQSELIFTDLNR